jgi:ATP-dependent exoDNAse (exonuclease V) beta subunit
MPLRDLLQPANSTALFRGSLMHAWCEQISWLDDGTPDPDLLRRVAARLAPGELPVEAWLQEFQSMLAAPGVAAALSRAAYLRPEPPWSELLSGVPVSRDALEIRREQDFVVPMDNYVVRGCIDRLVLVKQSGQVVAADILDFKTDAPLPVSASRLSGYREQLRLYRRAVGHLYGLPPDRIGARLVFLANGQIDPVH